MDLEKYNNEKLNIHFDEATEDKLIRGIATRLGMTPTDQQVEVAKYSNEDLIVIAEPGTGKTTTLKLSLFVNAVVKKIPVSHMTVISYTKAIVKDFKKDIKGLQKKLAMSTTFDIRTFHSVLLEYITALRGDKFTVLGDKEKYIYIAEQKKFVVKWLKRNKPGWADDSNVNHYLPHLITTIKNTNTYSKESIADNNNYQQILETTNGEITVEDIQMCAMSYVEHLAISRTIMQADIPPVAVYLQNFAHFDKETEEAVNKCKKKIVFIDEFQDLSIMELEILHNIAEVIVAVGDPNQSIYGFKGADPIVFKRLSELRECRKLQLSKSFRCSQASAEDNFEIIRENYKCTDSVDPYVGVDKPYSSNYYEFTDFMTDQLQPILDKYKKEMEANLQSKKVESTFILFRNNVDVFLMMYRMVENEIPFKMNKAYEGIYSLNGISSYMHIIRALLVPTNQKSIEQVSREASWDNMKKSLRELPAGVIYKAEKTYMDVKTEEEYIEDLRYIVDVMNTNGMNSSTPIKNYLMYVYDYYDKNNINTQRSLYSEDVISYHRIVLEMLIGNMSFDELSVHENEVKVFLAKEYESNITLSTFHSAKGLEANHVILMNISMGISPNEKSLEKIYNISKKEAAISLIQERNLLYVASTRAKDSLTTVYVNELSSLIRKQFSSDLIIQINDYIQHMDLMPNDAKCFNDIFFKMKTADFAEMS